MTNNNISVKPGIRPIKINENSSFSPVDFGRYFINPEEEKLHFTVKVDGGDLPEGLTFSEAGELSGKAAANTAKTTPYLLKVSATYKTEKWQFEVPLHVYTVKTADEITELRETTWRQLAEENVLPDSIEEILNRPISRADIYYLLQRFATFTIWNADDLRLAEGGFIVQLEDASKHFNVYDFDVCLVTTPKDLYTYDRTLSDAVQTAKAMVREVHRREWQVEFGGFDRMANAAWYEVNQINKTAEHQMEIRNYEPPGMPLSTNMQQAVSK